MVAAAHLPALLSPTLLLDASSERASPGQEALTPDANSKRASLGQEASTPTYLPLPNLLRMHGIP